MLTVKMKMDDRTVVTEVYCQIVSAIIIAVKYLMLEIGEKPFKCTIRIRIFHLAGCRHKAAMMDRRLPKRGRYEFLV